MVCVVRKLSEDLFANDKIPSLLSGKVLLDELAIGTSKVVEGVGDVLTDVNLPIGIGDLVNDLHYLCSPTNFLGSITQGVN